MGLHLSAMAIRHADPERDGAACAAAYAPAVTDGYASFEEVAPGAAEMAARIAAAASPHAWLVHERDGAITGYACAGPHHARPAYRWAAAVAVGQLELRTDAAPG